MLKVEVDPAHETASVYFDGTNKELVIGLCGAIGLLFARLNACNPVAGKKFRKDLTRMLTDPDSPVWDGRIPDGSGYAACIPVKKKED